MPALVVLAGCTAWGAQQQVVLKLTIPPLDQNRRFILAEQVIPASRLAPPFAMRDAESGAAVPCQSEPAVDGNVVRWVVDSLAAGKSRTFNLEHAETQPEPAQAMILAENPAGYLSVRNGDREITRYHFGAWAKQFNKPFFYPVIAQGVNVARGFPMEKKPGESSDHRHHTGLYFCHGEVNSRDYWAKLPITPKRLVQRTSGPAYARIVAENAWGNDLNELQDITILNAGDDVVMDWVITLTAANGPVNLGKTKEGGFAIRVATGITDKGGGKMVDAKGNKGEPAIRKEAAVWADDYGTVDGKLVGVAIMNHPKSWRFPTNWHVRGYGLFAANAFFEQGEYNLKQGESITLRYRVFVHGGDPDSAKAQEVYAGYANAAVKAE